MIAFNLKLVLGLGRAPAINPPSLIVPLDNAAIGAISSLAGSYHVHDMGRHFDDYVELLNVFPQLVLKQQIPDWPDYSSYIPLETKSRASSVTANIGEAILAIVAVNHLVSGIGDVIHAKVGPNNSRSKSPDYLLRLAGQLSPTLRMLPEIDALPHVPHWWPAEAKAEGNRDTNAPLKKAFMQLAAYWWWIYKAAPNDVGFGFITHCVYPHQQTTSNVPTEIRLHVFSPKDAARLQALFELKKDDLNAFLKSVRKNRSIRRFLHGC